MMDGLTTLSIYVLRMGKKFREEHWFTAKVIKIDTAGAELS